MVVVRACCWLLLPLGDVYVLLVWSCALRCCLFVCCVCFVVSVVLVFDVCCCLLLAVVS